MAEDGAVAARQYGRHLGGERRGHRMSDQVDASMDGVQPSRAQAVIDGTAAQTERDQLLSCDDAALDRSEPRDLPIRTDLANSTHGRSLETCVAPSIAIVESATDVLRKATWGVPCRSERRHAPPICRPRPPEAPPTSALCASVRDPVRLRGRLSRPVPPAGDSGRPSRPVRPTGDSGRPRRRPLLAAAGLLAALGTVALAAVSWAVWTETDARSALDEAFERPIPSARVALVLDAWAETSSTPTGREALTLRLDGPIRARGRDRPPELDWRIRGEAPGRTVDARVVVAGRRAVVTVDGTSYDVSRPLVDAVVAGFLEAPQPAAAGSPPLRPRRWFHDVSRRGEGVAAGAPTERFRTSLRLDLLLDDLIGAAGRVPGAGLVAPTDVLPTPSERRGLAFALRGASADVHVARGDGTLRAIDARGSFRVPVARRAAARGLDGGGFTFSVALYDDTDRPIEEPAPSDLKEGYGLSP